MPDCDRPGLAPPGVAASTCFLYLGVLPAEAGVLRRPTTRPARSPGPPRRRGGVPAGSKVSGFSLTSSPPTRGCSGDPGRGGEVVDVLPADAGVFRRPGCRARRCGRPPRRRGGVPSQEAAIEKLMTSTPPTRGCSEAVPPGSHQPPVLPADAGVFRPPARPSTRSPCPPADAGVFRTPTWRRRSSSRPPRRRGGVPLTIFLAKLQSGSSPPTRGCSAGACRHGRPSPVLPADAGVFRARPARSPRWPSPPRRRGGGPPRPTAARRPALSSPPTRGCSGLRWRRVRRGMVLPADAGVFRHPVQGGPLTPGPPRRRGVFRVGR